MLPPWPDAMSGFSLFYPFSRVQVVTTRIQQEQTMKITACVSIAVAMGILAGQTAAADPIARNHGINKRQENQNDRVRQGVKSGELTVEEARAIAGERSDIKKIEREYRADGVLTDAERKDLDQRLDEASRDILVQKHEK